MRIGIDISQTVYTRTGVANFVLALVTQLVTFDKKNEYVLFFSSLRQKPSIEFIKLAKENKNIQIKRFLFPPTILAVLWNRLHVLPIEVLIGPIDVFLSSDWVQPPTNAKAVTILYDLIVYTHPQETAKKIVRTQKNRLSWVKKECDKIICISQSTQKDAQHYLSIDPDKLVVVYPGI